MEFDSKQVSRLAITSLRSRRLGSGNTARASHGNNRDAPMRSENCTTARTYAIKAQEKASAPDVITSIFFIFDVKHQAGGLIKL